MNSYLLNRKFRKTVFKHKKSEETSLFLMLFGSLSQHLLIASVILIFLLDKPNGFPLNIIETDAVRVVDMADNAF